MRASSASRSRTPAAAPTAPLTIPPRSRPDRRPPGARSTAPGTSAARAGSTATSSPPDVVASHTRRARHGATPAGEVREALGVLAVAAAAAGHRALVLEHELDAVERRDGCGVDLAPRRRSRARARAGARAGRSRSRRSWPSAPAATAAAPASALSAAMTATARASRASSACPRLRAVTTAPAPSGLVSTSASPTLAAGVGDHAVGVHGAGDREAVLGLWVVDRVPADDLGAGGAHDVHPAAQHLAQRGRAQLLERPGHEVQRGQRPARPSRRRRTARWPRRCGRSRRGRRRPA